MSENVTSQADRDIKKSKAAVPKTWEYEILFQPRGRRKSRGHRPGAGPAKRSSQSVRRADRYLALLLMHQLGRLPSQARAGPIQERETGSKRSAT
jgi:hypothetical protein